MKALIFTWQRSLSILFLAAIAALNSVQGEEVRTRSTFHCISLYWTRSDTGPCTVRFRPAGETVWKQGQALWYDRESGSPVAQQYRGSLVNLRPGTAYEIELATAAGKETRRLIATTWTEDFRIKKCIAVSSLATFATTEGGSATEGYVLFDGTGSTLDARTESSNALLINHSYVIVRGLTMVNARQHAVVVASNLTDVVIERCDISQWGSARKPLVNARWGASEAGIKVESTARRVIIQRNKIHHPRHTSTLWNEDPQDSHPRGPRAILLGHRSNDEDWEANHVVRYNECFSDSDHLFEDVIGGGLNYSNTGHPGQDSDIYGNRISHAADDLIEADGGGMNVRIWGNHMEHGSVFISLQSCPLGPVYFFRNIIGRSLVSIREGKPGWCGFKFVGNATAFDLWATRNGMLTPFRGPVYVYHNTMLHADAYTSVFNVHPGDHVRNVVSRNNIALAAKAYLNDGYDGTKPPRAGHPPADLDFVDCSFDYDLHNCDSTGDSVAEPQGSHLLKGEPRWRMGHGPMASAPGRYQIAQDSPGHNRGVALPNFNRGADEEGGAPDIGAHEFDAPHFEFGVNATWRVN